MQKKIMLVLLFIFVIFVNGCSDGSTPIQEEPEYLFATSGDYTLSEYLYPSTDQINNYKVSIYLDESGNERYGDDANISYPYREYIWDDNGTLSLWINKNLTATYTESDTKIFKYTVEENRTMEIVRHVDEGNYLVKYSYTESNQDQFTSYDFSCIAKDIRKDVAMPDGTQQDVLHFSCLFEIRSEGLINSDTEYETLETGTYDLEYAKGIGLYRSQEESCKSTILNTLEDKSCKKTVTELISII